MKATTPATAPKRSESLTFGRAFMWMNIVVLAFALLAAQDRFGNKAFWIILMCSIGLMITSFVFGLLYQLYSVENADRGRIPKHFWMLLVQSFLGLGGFIMAAIIVILR